MRFFITVLVLLSINSIFTNKAGTYQNATVILLLFIYNRAIYISFNTINIYLNLILNKK